MTRDKLVEMMVRRQYLKKGVNLPPHFWNLPDYKRDYRREVMLAAKLYRAYSEEAITNVMERETWCFSLAAKKLANMIEIEERRLALVAKQLEIKEENKTTVVPTGNDFRRKPKKDFRDVE